MILRSVTAAAASSGDPRDEYVVPALGLNGVAGRLMEVQDTTCVVAIYDWMTSSTLFVSVPAVSVHAVDKTFGELMNEGVPMVRIGGDVW